jgi:Restriction endonuclease XhoI
VSGASYRDRYEIFCRRLVEERLYDAACFVALRRDATDPLEEPASDLSFAAFASAIRERAEALAALREEL